MGDFLSGLFGFLGTQQTNQANWDISQSNNAWSAQQFAQRYQTTVADLQKAGLNPMLAYGQGGGSPPTAAPVAPMQNRMASAMSSYNERRANDSIVELQGEEKSLKEKQGVAAVAQANQADTQANLNNANAKVADVQALKIVADTATSTQDEKLKKSLEKQALHAIQLLDEQVKTQRTQQNLNSANAGVQAIEQQLRQEKLYKEKVTKAPYEWVDKNIIQKVKPYLQLPTITVEGTRK